ncbi:unnamed protein product, partial [Didymodactylos carnosus]
MFDDGYNEFDWCPLDLAIMLNNVPMIKLLIQYGAKESEKIQPEDRRYRSVCCILEKLDNEPTSRKNSRLTVEDTQRKSREKRRNMYIQMKENYEQS